MLTLKEAKRGMKMAEEEMQVALRRYRSMYALYYEAVERTRVKREARAVKKRRAKIK